MKSLKEVKEEIKELLSVDRNKHKESELNRFRRRLQYLNIMKAYLESEPTEDFLLKEKKRLSDRLDKINDGYKAWASCNTAENPMKEYQKVMGVKAIKDHMKSISFILN